MRLAWIPAACAVAALLGGCAQSADAPTSSPAITVTSTATPAPIEASAPPAAELTEPGAALGATDTLVVPALAADARGHQTEVTLALTLGSVTPAEVDDIADVLTETDIEGLWNHHPVLVRYTATVSGPAVPAGYTITEPPPMTGITTTGGDASGPPSQGDPAACPALDVTQVSSDGTGEGCWVLMVRNDAELAALQYRGTFQGRAANYITSPVTWAVS